MMEVLFWATPSQLFSATPRLQAAVETILHTAQSLSRIRLCDAMDCSPPGSSVHGILQARIQEWVAISFSRELSLPRDRICVSYVFCIGGGFFTNMSHQIRSDQSLSRVRLFATP